VAILIHCFKHKLV